MKLNKRQRGMSLIEILISMAVLTIAIMAMMNVMAYSVQGTRSTAKLSDAVYIGKALCEAIKIDNGLSTTNNPDWVSGDVNERTPITAAPFDTLAVSNGIFRALDTDGDGIPDEGIDTNGDGTPDERDLSRFTRNIQLERLSNDVANYRNGLWKVTVAVFYNHQQGAGFSGEAGASGGSGEKVYETYFYTRTR